MITRVDRSAYFVFSMLCLKASYFLQIDSHLTPQAVGASLAGALIMTYEPVSLCGMLGTRKGCPYKLRSLKLNDIALGGKGEKHTYLHLYNEINTSKNNLNFSRL